MVDKKKLVIYMYAVEHKLPNEKLRRQICDHILDNQVHVELKKEKVKTS